MKLHFTDPFDEILAEEGPAAIFTLSHEGELRVDLMRTRELRRQNVAPFPIQHCHCVIIDDATKWPQYALITSANLCREFTRGKIKVCSSYQEALQIVSQYKSEFYAAHEE